MGWFRLFFFNEKPVQKTEITVGDMEGWFNSRVKNVYDGLDKEIRLTKDKIQVEIRKSKENMVALKEAQLHNPKIPVREKQFMEGNRTSYLKSVNIFLDNLKIGTSDYNDILSFCSQFNNNLDFFGKTTVKPYHILQHFFSHESSAIARNVKNIDNLVKELRQIIEKSGFKAIEETKDEINNLRNKINRKENLNEDLQKKKKKKKSLEQEKKKVNESIEKTKEKKEFIQNVELKKEIEKKKNEIKGVESELIHHFLPLEKALKKYARISLDDGELINAYLNSPIEALAQDNELKILTVIENLKKNILNGSIDLEEKRKEKSMQRISETNKDFLKKNNYNYEELKKKIAEKEEMLKSNTVENEIADLENKLKSVDDNIKRNESEILRLTKEIERTDINNLKEILKKKIKESVNEEVAIS